MKSQFSSGTTLISLAANETKVLIQQAAGIVRRFKFTNTGNYPVWCRIGEDGAWFYLEAKTEYPINFPEEPMSMPNLYVKTFDASSVATGLAAYAY